MGKKQDQMLMAAIQSMQAQLAKMQDPASNPTQQFLTNESLAGAEWLKKGDYSQLPKGMFFDFKMPSEENEQYKKMINVNQGGTFALADNAGRTEATGLQKQYLADKFARDTSQNYQDNVANAAANVRGGLAAAAGAKSQNDAQIMSAMQGLTSSIASMPKKTPWWQSLIGAAGGIMGGLGSMGLKI